MLALLVLASCTLTDGEPRSACPATPSDGSVDQVADSFPLRRDRFADSLVAKRSDWWDLDAQKGVVLLERAARTGDTSRVGEANDLIYNAAARIDDGDSNAALIHGGAFTFLRAVLLYGNRPELLRPATRARLVDGRTRDGGGASERVAPQVPRRALRPQHRPGLRRRRPRLQPLAARATTGRRRTTGSRPS